MPTKDKIDLILSRTIELLTSTDDPNELTTRKIADNAGINPAMVNYYFGSKEELLKRAMAKLHDIDHHSYPENPRKEMLELLMSVYEMTVLRSRYGIAENASGIADDVEKHSIRLASVISSYHSGRVEMGRCHREAYRLVSYVKTISLDPALFSNYFDTDLKDKGRMKVMISGQLDDVLGSAL